MDQALPPELLRRRRHVRVAAALLLLAGFVGAAFGVNRLLRPSLAPADIIVSSVRRGDVASTVNAAGVVIPVHEEVVASPVASRVARVHAKPGQRVAQGAANASCKCSRYAWTPPKAMAAAARRSATS